MSVYDIFKIVLLSFLLVAVIARISLRRKYDIGKLQLRSINFVIFTIVASLLLHLSLEKYMEKDLIIFPIIFILLLLLVLFLKNFKIFSKKCLDCSVKRSFTEIMQNQNRLCFSCQEKEDIIASTKARMPQKLNYTSPFVDQIDWENWAPTMSAVLGFLVKGDEVILIHKKTGLGKGKINAPGGKIEKGETAEEAVIREIKEEICLDMKNPVQIAELHFQFTDGLKLHTKAFVCYDFQGEMCETDEALPFWQKINDLPFEKMWEDDRHWLPLFFRGKKIKAYFTFDDDKMLDKKIVFL